jgi:hypothetical protein
MSNKPAFAIREFFPITGSIWRNESPDAATGETRVWYSATVERQYRDKAGNWQNTGSFSGDELLVVAKVADIAHTQISRFRAQDRAAQNDERSPGQEG